MSDHINSRLNFHDGTGLKSVLVETSAELVKVDNYENLQDFLNQTSQVKINDGIVTIRDTVTGEWVELEIPTTPPPEEDPIIPAPPLGNVTGMSATVNGNNVIIKWTDPSDITVTTNRSTEILTEWKSTKLVYKVGSIPADDTDGTLAVESTVRNQYSVEGYTVSGLPKEQEIYFKAFPVDTAGVIVNSDDNVVSATILEFTDTSGAPGLSTLIAGDETAGFFGEVSDKKFIDPDSLAEMIGLTAGESYAYGTWLKFVLDGKILFTTMGPARIGVSWDQLNAIGAVKGTKIIQISGNTYKVRLFKGAKTDPYSFSAIDRGAKGSEWNRLMLPIHAQAEDKSWENPLFVEKDVPDWGIGYTDEDLLLHHRYGEGSYIWCQETPSELSSYRIFRGGYGVSFSYYGPSSSEATGCGWMPVLELIPEEDIADNSGAPGSPVLLSGDKTAGFFGEVPNEEFITPTALATNIGLTAGTSFNTDTPWLKFVLDGKILFTTKKPIRYGISWNQLNAVGATKGFNTVRVSGKTYKVRLFKGASSDPYSYNAADRGAKGSEWNRLMLPIHIQSKDKSWAHPVYVEDNVPDWGIGYTDEDLLTLGGNGAYTWCQETPSENTSNRTIRGLTGVSYSSINAASGTNAIYGWRPVLELISDDDIVDETGTPGSPALLAGDNKAGFFGEVSNPDLITPASLASTIGLSVGTSYNEDTPWLKFILNGKILFTTKKPIRHSLSWDQINNAGVVKGAKVVKVGGKVYRVRLFRGAKTDPYSTTDDFGAKGSEWNRLLLPIHINAKDKSWKYPDYVEDNVPNWNIGYTDADLLTHNTNGSGSYTWCQETPSSYLNQRMFRGYNGVSSSSYNSSSLTTDKYGWRPVLELIPEEEFIDKSGSPGSPALLAGDTKAGFFGEVPNADLITPTTLASTIGLTEGTSINADTPWLKFILDGKILFTTKKPIKHTVSWSQINSAGATKGTTTIKISDKIYKVRLFKGALTDPYSTTGDYGAKGSEWNRLMLPIHIQAKDKSWDYPQYVEDNVPDWGIGYTDADLLTRRTHGNGSCTWCQETSSASNANRSLRGNYGVSNAHFAASSSTHTDFGWRPVLELVPEEDIVDKTGAPGSPVLIAGDTKAGFFGEVKNTDLITPVTLASKIGLSAGVSYNTDTPWLKFILDGKILFTTKKPVRYNIAWNQINTAGAVNGTRAVRINDNSYKIRLFKGAKSDPYWYSDEDHGAKGSEWNRLMLPIHIEAKDKSWKNPRYVEDNIPDWGIGYTDKDLLTDNNQDYGSYTWCQETPSDFNTYRLVRGYDGVTYSDRQAASGVSGSCGWRPVLELIPEEDIADKSGSPGSPVLRAGDTKAGFFGEVPSGLVINPVLLASKVGLTAGTSVFGEIPWLKFILDGKILFTSKKPIKNNLSWDHLDAAGVVKGNKIIQISDKYYKVRLFKGAKTDPYSYNATDRGAKGSEWNRLMLPIHIHAKDKAWAYPAYVESNVPNWNIGYTDADLLTHSTHGNGSYTWCQETPSESPSTRSIRGGFGVSTSDYGTSSGTGTHFGWRPIIELIPDEEIIDKSGAPGSPVLLAGDKTAGFFGEVKNSELIAPTTLASNIGLSAGTSYNTDTPWLKFILDGNILFTTKKPIRHTISWDQINSAGVVTGDKTIKISGVTYKVRLFKGTIKDPYYHTATDREAKGSEWNRLMLPIHIQSKDDSWSYKAYVERDIPSWNIGYTDEDLLTHQTYGAGSYTWCQGKSSEYSSRRCVRGHNGVSYADSETSSGAYGKFGWRPVLELVQ